MIGLVTNHDAGLGSLLTVTMSQLLKFPLTQPVHVHMCSKVYAPAGDNMFDWYFSNPPVSRVTKTQEVVYDDQAFPHTTQLGKDLVRLRGLRATAERRLRLRSSSLIAKSRFLNHPRTLGIHYRGTDKFTEIARVPYETTFRKFQKLPETYSRVFLSTDETAAAEWFAKRIPGLILNPHQRTDNPGGLHLTQGGRQQADETMLDIRCLSLCDTLLVTRSNFSDWALILGHTEDIHYGEDGDK
jgi:hypothetical protein